MLLEGYSGNAMYTSVIRRIYGTHLKPITSIIRIWFHNHGLRSKCRQCTSQTLCPKFTRSQIVRKIASTEVFHETQLITDWQGKKKLTFSSNLTILLYIQPYESTGRKITPKRGYYRLLELDKDSSEPEKCLRCMESAEAVIL